jgi:hypothetical protein
MSAAAMAGLDVTIVALSSRSSAWAIARFVRPASKNTTWPGEMIEAARMASAESCAPGTVDVATGGFTAPP